MKNSEVKVGKLKELEDRLRKIDEGFYMTFYCGIIRIRHEDGGRPIKTSSINRLENYVEQVEKKGGKPHSK